jgi:hypothetical protein
MSRATTITVVVEMELTVEVTRYRTDPTLDDDGGDNEWVVTHHNDMKLLPKAAELLGALCAEEIEDAVEEERG